MIKVKITGLQEVKNKMNKLKNLSTDTDFRKFIQNKCMQLLLKQTDERISSITSQETADLSEYRANHKIEETSTGFILYNETTKTQSEISESIRINYPNGFSIAKAVEYGIGYVGKTSPAINAADDGWEYDVNNHGEQGWHFGNNPNFAGYTGREIYYNTSIEIKRLMQEWVNEYIKNM